MAGKAKHLLNATAYVKIISCLFAGPHTVAELAEESGFTDVTINKLIRLFKKEKLIYIASWEKDPSGRRSRAAYTFGTKDDTKKPKPQTRKERYIKEKQLLGSSIFTWRP